MRPTWLLPVSFFEIYARVFSTNKYYIYISKANSIWKYTFYRSLQEGQDIFGVDFDYEEFEKYGEEDYEDEDEEDLDEYLEDEEEEGNFLYFFFICLFFGSW